MACPAYETFSTYQEFKVICGYFVKQLWKCPLCKNMPVKFGGTLTMLCAYASPGVSLAGLVSNTKLMTQKMHALSPSKKCRCYV